MRKIHLLLAPLLLTSCDSDDNRSTGESSSAPTPAPSPTPSPSPSPTPSPTPTPTSGYTPYSQITGQVSLATAEAGYVTNSTPPQFRGFNAFSTGPALQYDATARSYGVTIGSTAETFTSSEIDGSAAAGTTRYVKANGHTFTVTQPTAGGKGFDYLRFARLVTAVNSAPVTATFLTGMPTLGADVPTTGSTTYSRTVVTGEAYVTANGTTTAYTLGGSTLTITINFATGIITGRMVIIGTPVTGGANVTLSTIDAAVDFSGQGTVTASGGDFTPDPASRLSGVLFGPKGAEAGLLLYLQARSQAGATMTLVATGAAGT